LERTVDETTNSCLITERNATPAGFLGHVGD
jgi:hypothetical protein